MRQRISSSTPDARRNSQRSANRADDVLCSGRRHMVARECRGNVILVAGGKEASDDRHTEGATHLEGHGIGSRSNPGVALGDRTHHGVGRRGDQQAGTQTDEQKPRKEITVRGDWSRRGRDLPEGTGNGSQSGRNGEFHPDDARQERRESGTNDQHTGHGQDAEAGLQGREAENELQELGEQEQRSQ